MKRPIHAAAVAAQRGERAAMASIATGAALTIAGAAWYAALMRGIWAAEALGPICRHGGALALHCPACPAALALAAAGVLVAASGLDQTRGCRVAG